MRLELTRGADYAIRTTICLAREEGDQLLSAPAIARRMNVPRRFLPQIMQDLVRAGLVEGAPGRGGGYRLTRAPEDVSLLEVIEAVEGDVRRRTCVLRSDPCSPATKCGVHDMFAAAQDALLEQLARATVQDAATAAADEVYAA